MNIFRMIALVISILALPSLTVAQSTSLWDRVPNNMKTRNSFKRFEWFYRQRAFPSDTIPVEHFYREHARERAKQLDAASSAVSWTPLGPNGLISTWPPAWGQLSGRIRGVAVHPTDPNTVYVGAAGGGIWKTTNGGTHWTSLSDDFPNITFGAIAIDPNTPNNVYAGTGEVLAGFNIQNLDGRGLFKSTNAGATWTQITNGFGAQTHFGAVAVNPFNSNIILAALGSGYSFLGNMTNEGIWRSTDAGTTWARVISVDGGYDVVFHPTTTGRVFASAGSGSFVYVSTDAGVTWAASNSGIPTTNLTRVQLAIAPSSPSTMYAFAYVGSTRAYKSTNDGSSWFQISSGVNLGGTYDGVNYIDQGWYDACIAVKPNDPNFVLLGNIEMYRATDGASLAPVRLPGGPYGGTRAWDSPVHVDIHKIVYAPSNPNVAYLGCDGGVYRSTDGGLTWNSANALISTIQYYRIASHPTNRNIVIGGAQDNGNYKTIDRGATPWALTTTGDGMECLFDYTNPNIVFASTQNGNLLRSTSGGDYGTYVQVRPAWDVTPNWTTPLISHPINSATLYTGSRRIWKTENSGSSWTAISASIATSDVINDIAIGKTNPSIMAVAASGYSNQNPQVLLSTDAGVNWSDVTARVPGAARYVSRVVIHPLDANTIFVVRSGFGSGKLYRSNDLGQTFSDVTGDLPNVPGTDFFIDPVRPRHWYLANDLGVYLSTNAGANWQRQSAGIPILPMIDFDYFSSGGTRLLRVASHGRGAYEAQLSLDSVPTIFAVPLAKSFNKVEANVGSDTAIATIHNFSTQPLTVNSITKNSAAFTLVNLPSLPAIIPAQSSIQFRIGFRPSAHGLATDSVRIASNDAANPVIFIPLAGRGVLIGRAVPGVMYAVGNGNTYNVNTNTAAATFVGSLGVASLDGLTIRHATKELYGMSSTSLNTQLYRVSQQFGEALHARLLPLANVRAIAFNNADQLFAATSTGSLYRISLTTGDTVFVGNNGLAYAGLSFSPVNGELWASVRPAITNRDRIYKIGTSNGSATLVGATGDNAVTPSITFNPLGLLYGLKGTATQTNTLIRIDTTTGAGTTIGSLNISGIAAITMRTDSIATSVEEAKVGVPTQFTLHQNYPNPFNPTTTIRFDLPAAGFVSLKVYNMLGEEVAALVSEYQTAGYKIVQFDGSKFSSGAYVYKLTAGAFSAQKKLLMIK